MSKILDVSNLRISFKTNNGTVKAVRDINFSLERGQTLAIVGESGSGKSVTSRAIMGILAGNAIVESGEIFFDGKDLMKISEDDFHQIRGNRISMIFQDPFSSLNPIVRIGRQLTEAMVLNGRANQRDARKEFNQKIRLLTESVRSALAADASTASRAAQTSAKIAEVKRFTAKGNKMEKVYNTARENIETMVTAINGCLIDIIHGEPRIIIRALNEIIKGSERCYHKYLFERDGVLPGLIAELKVASKKYVADGNREKITELMTKMRELFGVALALPLPDFFSMGYYLTHHDEGEVFTNQIVALNEKMRSFMQTNFLDSFYGDMQLGLRYAHDQKLEKMKKVHEQINLILPLFDDNNISKSKCREIVKDLTRDVEASIDRLAINKNSFAYTFKAGFESVANEYLLARKLTAKKRLTKKEAALIVTHDVEIWRENIRTMLIRIRDSYANAIENADKIDYLSQSVEMMAHLKDNASKMVYRVTNSMAKSRAISLMEEVGIADARARYRQYPFQFSGGMRQRIVIAIALAANPDILICDEPSTALDVTIQGQILDLIKSLKEKRGLSVIFITHDMGVVANMADHIAVMYAGKIVEYGTVDDIFYEPAHPYTWALLASMPDLETKEKLEAIAGTPPNMINPPVGDAFAPRNKYAMGIDFEQQPPFFEMSPTHKAATWLLHPSAPKVEPPKIVTERITRMRNMEVSDDE